MKFILTEMMTAESIVMKATNQIIRAVEKSEDLVNRYKDRMEMALANTSNWTL
ncbi:MAG: hypothetical protein HRU41_00355 [Saprospiraceae bacterium]|nr:hypothetical protein [Saprospiraceae bacterium]